MRLAADNEIQLGTALREQSVIRESRLHRGIGHSKVSVVIKFHSLIVKRHEYEIIPLIVEVKAYTDRCHVHAVEYRTAELVIDLLEDFLSAKRDTLSHDTHLFGERLGKPGDLASASDNEHGRNRLASVEFFDLVGHILCDIGNDALRDLMNFLRLDLVLDAHDVGILNRTLLARIDLHMFRFVEIQKEGIGNDLRQLITRLRDHPVCDYASVLRYRYIARTCADIDKRDIEHPVHVGYRSRHRRDRLESKVCDFEVRYLNRLIETVNNIIRQECRDQVDRYA